MESLLQGEGWPAVSLYMPVSRIGDPQDSLRYKNFISQVEAKLVEEGMRSTQARALLESEFNLARDASYWQHLGAEGLAVFLSSEQHFRYPLQTTVGELVLVARRFHIRPLLPLQKDGRHRVLALSRKKLQLFEGDRYRFEEIDLPEGTPRTMEEALQYDKEPELQFHSRTASAAQSGRRSAMFHGHGAGDDDHDLNIERYYQLVDRCLFPLLEDQDCPLILAGTEEQHAVFRRVTRSRTVLPQGIPGHVSEFPIDVLRARAWEMADQYHSRAIGEAIADYRDNLGGTRVAADLPSILTAACDGRVENLFVAEDELVFGFFDPVRRDMSVVDGRGGKPSELLDEAVYWTLQQKGAVYVRRREEMPVDAVICARMRY